MMTLVFMWVHSMRCNGGAYNIYYIILVYNMCSPQVDAKYLWGFSLQTSCGRTCPIQMGSWLHREWIWRKRELSTIGSIQKFSSCKPQKTSKINPPTALGKLARGTCSIGFRSQTEFGQAYLPASKAIHHLAAGNLRDRSL